MHFEHFAINVPEPQNMARWYAEHLGAKIVKQSPAPPYMHFLADTSGRVFMEIYHNPKGPVTDFKSLHHLTFHFAFTSEDASADKERLLASGATLVEELRPEKGTVLVMLRDPWNVPLQICQRTRKLA